MWGGGENNLWLRIDGAVTAGYKRASRRDGADDMDQRKIIDTRKNANGQRIELTYSDPRDCGGWEVTSWGPERGVHNWTVGARNQAAATLKFQEA